MTFNINPSGSTFTPGSVAITGGTIDNTAIGATTPVAGTFTTLTGNTPAAGNNSTSVATTAFVRNLSSGIAALTSTGGSQTLTAAQYGCGILSLSGTLTSNCVLVVPTAGTWIVKNGTTGAFAVQVKTSGGTGVYVSQGQSTQVFADGTNVVGAIPANASWLVEWTNGAVVTNGTTYLTIYAPYAGTILAMDYFTAASTSFIANVQIAGVSVTGLSAVTVNSATQASTSATAANVFAAGQVVSIAISSATSSPTNAVLSLRILKA